jgi:hypothetical protein
MSNLWATTYDYAVAVTKSDSTDDPAGPFSGLYVSVSGNVVLYCRNGPQSAQPITVAVVAGDYIRWPVRRVGSTSTTATVFGLVSSIIAQGS